MSIYLYFVAFISGLVSLALELTASRLLEPFFGTTNLVWAAIIGMILLFLAIGYALGGRWADRAPQPATLYTILVGAGVTIAAVPFAAQPVLRFASRGFLTWNVGQITGTFIAVLALFSIPVTLLACVSPFVIRLALTDVRLSGITTGKIYAISTAGSFLGTFLPTLLLIPNIGTRCTFLLLALLTIATGLYGLWHTDRSRFWKSGWLLPLLVLLIYRYLPIIYHGEMIHPPTSIKPQPGLLYEAESAYNFIQVLEDANGMRHLLLNEGQGIHSVTVSPEHILTGGPWDYYLIAPYFNNPPYTITDVKNLLIIGLAAGTTALQYTEIYGPIPIDGVEIDPAIVKVGRDYFGMTQPNLHVHIADGRYFLRQTNQKYDVVAVDAYRLPYIPWHLTTMEFFQQVSSHLTPTGVVAINVGHTPDDWRLVAAMAATMRTVYPSVHVIAVPGTLNALVIATVQTTTSQNLAQNLNELEHPHLKAIARRALENLQTLAPSTLIFTDDCAPVEQLTNDLALRYLLGQ
ncbi:MAG: fused MFS/spermidine synthase [Anaerolineae bacterium]|nr:fused MFS/spermidine synthase [Anaerolineae bacterium]